MRDFLNLQLVHKLSTKNLQFVHKFQIPRVALEDARLKQKIYTLFTFGDVYEQSVNFF